MPQRCSIPALLDRPLRATTDEVHVWRIPLESAPDELACMRALLSGDERQRADRFVFDRDRDRFTIARARLRLLLGRYLDKGPASLEFRYGRAGKPELTLPGPPFNVSHSHGMALIAAGGPGRIGVDIERIDARRPSGSIDGFFAPSEKAAIMALPAELRQRAFFACWTRKEAFLKALGDGIGFGLDRFEVSVSPDAPAKLLHVADDAAEAARWELRSLDIAQGFAAALAVEGHRWELRSFDWRIDA